MYDLVQLYSKGLALARCRGGWLRWGRRGSIGESRCAGVGSAVGESLALDILGLPFTQLHRRSNTKHPA